MRLLPVLIQVPTLGTCLASRGGNLFSPTHTNAMTKLYALALAGTLIPATIRAQTSDLVFFTDDGLKFTLVIDGDVKNTAPAARVLATGIRTESPMVMIRFEDASIPQLRKPGYFALGKEYTIMITTNKKGERVLRPTGEAELGTAASAEPVKPKPADFQDDRTRASDQQSMSVQQNVQVDGVLQSTTVTVVEEDMGSGTTDGVNMSMGVNGVGINMNVDITEGGSSGSTTTTTRTTTTTTSSGTGRTEPARPAPVAEPYRMPGYTGPIGCAMPLSDTEFADLKKSIGSKSFEETKLTMAKQVTGERCLTVEQVKGIMSVFGFEDSKLEFAKFAYDHTHDPGNYYKVNDAFTFESSIEELDEYIKSR